MWRVGDFCRVLHKDGGLHNATVLALEPAVGMATVLLVDFQAEIEVRISQLLPLQQNPTVARGPSAHGRAAGHAPMQQPARGSFASPGRTSWSGASPASVAPLSRRSTMSPPASRGSMSPGPPEQFHPQARRGSSGPLQAWGTPRASFSGQGSTVPQRDYPESVMGDASGPGPKRPLSVEFDVEEVAVPDYPDAVAETQFGGPVQLRAKRPPPGYEGAPEFDGEGAVRRQEAVEQEARRHSALEATRAHRNSTGLLTQGSSLYQVAQLAKATLRFRGAPGNRVERKRQQEMHRRGEFMNLKDLVPAEKPDTREAYDDVRTHQFLLERAKRGTTCLKDRLGEYREEKVIVEQQKVYMSYVEQIKLWATFKVRHAKEAAYGYFSDYQLFRSSILKVEAKFGSAVVSYFEFLRYLFLLNVFYGMSYMLFLVIPQLVAGTGASGTIAGATFSGIELLSGGGAWCVFLFLSFSPETLYAASVAARLR